MGAKTGTSMSGVINTRNVKAVKCNCPLCYHSERLYSKTLGISKRYCRYYNLIDPNKKSCARYYQARGSSTPSKKNKQKKSK